VITRLPRGRTIAVAVAFVIVSVALTLLVWRSIGGSTPLEPKGYRVDALFTNASQLTRNADVRISGVNVGSVAAIEPDGLRTRATIEVKREYAPLPSDVRAILRQKTLLGETFVALSPGSRDARPLRDGETIDVKQIEATQPLDRLLGMFDETGRKRMSELLTDTGTLLDGRAQDLNDSFGNFAVGTRQLEVTVGILDDQRDDVAALVRDSGRVLDTIGAEQTAVDRLIRAGDAALSATADRDAALTATVRAAPELLRELRAASIALERTAVVAGPTLRALRPVAPLVEPALSDLNETAPEVKRVLVDFERVLPAARRALPAAARFTDGLRPFMQTLEPLAREITPVISYVAGYRKELVATLANVAAATDGTAPATNGVDTAYLRTLVPLGPETRVGAERRVASNRHNAYPAPGGLARLRDGLLASNCANAGDSPTPAPPCRVQPGWSFAGGPRRYFQRLQPGPGR
jgi:virulence factor Mce-like protein